MSYEQCHEYFRGKIASWNSIPPDNHWKRYVSNCGRPKLVQEFRSDTLFQSVVCPLIKQYAVQEQKNVAASILQDVLSLYEGNLVPVEIDLVVGAVLEACNYSNLGSQFLKTAVVAIILGALIAIVFRKK